MVDVVDAVDAVDAPHTWTHSHDHITCKGGVPFPIQFGAISYPLYSVVLWKISEVRCHTVRFVGVSDR